MKGNTRFWPILGAIGLMFFGMFIRNDNLVTAMLSIAYIMVYLEAQRHDDEMEGK